MNYHVVYDGLQNGSTFHSDSNPSTSDFSDSLRVPWKLFGDPQSVVKGKLFMLVSAAGFGAFPKRHRHPAHKIRGGWGWPRWLLAFLSR